MHRISTSALTCCCESAANRGLRSPARNTAIELSRSLFIRFQLVYALADYCGSAAGSGELVKAASLVIVLAGGPGFGENPRTRPDGPGLAILGDLEMKEASIMAVHNEERHDAENTGELVGKKLREIMDLQADIDALLRDKHPTPFGSQRWQYASLEALQRLVAMTAVQFLLFEPVEWVKGNEEVKVTAEKLLTLLANQLKALKTDETDWHN